MKTYTKRDTDSKKTTVLGRSTTTEGRVLLLTKRCGGGTCVQGVGGVVVHTQTSVSAGGSSPGFKPKTHPKRAQKGSFLSLIQACSMQLCDANPYTHS
jgi:hypothetical protein